MADQTGTIENWEKLDHQVSQARELLVNLSSTIEDIEDAKAIEQAKAANGDKPTVPWAKACEELGLDK